MSVLACAAPMKVEVKSTGDQRHQLIVDGKPFFIQGAGGSYSRSLLKDLGGNAIRTWGVDQLDDALAEAEKNGLKVCAGIWIEHERHGFTYDDPAFIQKQFDRAKAAVEKYKDHPALLIWAIGNEMEGEKGDNPKIWKAVNDIAKMVKEIDPNHPTMTVVAELGGEKVPSLETLCPDIDILGINSYAGATSIPERYRKLGGTKPYIVTEFGPFGTWEIPKNDWNVVQEPTSTVKAGMYRDSYRKAIAAEKGKLCLGSFVFNWGNKQEATSTWFGMFLQDGSRTGSVDVMQEAWTGKPPANRVPVIGEFAVDLNRGEGGSIVKATLRSTDPEQDKLDAEWKLFEETERYSVGGDLEKAPPEVSEAITNADLKGATVTLPKKPGAYRLYVTVRDHHNGAATVNVPLLVLGEVTHESQRLAPKATLPFTLLGDDAKGSTFVPSGWMGKADAIKLDPQSKENPHSGATSMKCEFNSSDNFGGVVWQSPEGDWGEVDGGLDFSGAKKLTFWARGEAGGEKVEFKLGIIEKTKAFFDTASGATTVTLSPEWKQYELDLNGKDLRRIKTPFVWVVGNTGRSVAFYLDDVRFTAD
jgi:hypothetical protein